MSTNRYRATGVEAEFEPGSRLLDFSPMLGRGRRIYIGGIHAAMGRDYRPLAAVFEKIIARSKQRAAANTR